MVELQQEFPGRLEVLAFPCDQFGAQELSTGAEVKEFVGGKFGFKRFIMAKSSVNGADTNPVYKWLRATSGNDADIKWNFASSFLVSPAGTQVTRFDKMPKSWDAVKSAISSMFSSKL